MANKNELKLIITADGSLGVAGVGKIKDSLKDLKDNSKSFSAEMKDHWFALTATFGSVMAAVYTLKRVYNEFAAAFERQEKRIAFENLANSVGSNSAKIVSAVRAASGELLTVQETIEMSSRALLLGLQPDAIEKLMRVAKASTKVTGQTIAQAFSDITFGVARQSRLILDNLGLIIDYESALQRLKATLGKTESQITDTDRRQAFLNATFEAGEKIISRVGNNFDTLNERLNKFNTGTREAKTLFWDYITGVSTLDRAISASKYPALIELYDKQKTELDKLLPTFEKVREEVNAMLRGEAEPRQSVINKFTELEKKVISLQRALNAASMGLGIGETATVSKPLIPEAETPIPFDLKKWSEEQVKYEKEVGDALRAEAKFLEESRLRDIAAVKELSAAREADIQMQLRQIDLAEQEFRISKADAVSERIRLMRELIIIQEDYQRTLDKSLDPASWYAQQNAIDSTRESLIKLNLELKEQTGTFTEGFSYGFQKFEQDAKTSFQYGQQAAEDAANAIGQTFESISFDAMQGKLKTLGDYFRSFLSSMQQSVSNILGQLVTQLLMLGVKSLFGGLGGGGMISFPGLAGEAANPIFGHTGGYIPRFHFGGLSSDEVPAILQRGEYVINRRAVDAVGKSTLDNINTGRGANRTSNNYFIIDPEAAEAYSKMSERQIESRITKLMKDNRLKQIRR